jgi:hypothetical protein
MKLSTKNNGTQTNNKPNVKNGYSQNRGLKKLQAKLKKLYFSKYFGYL